MPQFDSEAGIGLRSSHPPLAYSKKSTPGSTDGFMLAARKSPLPGPFVVVAPWVQASGRDAMVGSAARRARRTDHGVPPRRRADRGRARGIGHTGGWGD